MSPDLWIPGSILAILLAAIAVALLRRKQNPDQEAPSWTAGPDISGLDYSAGVIVASDGSFDFPQPPASVHYVTRAAKPGEIAKASRIRLRYQISAAPGASFIGSDGKPTASGPTLYFEAADDDWVHDGGRWWATFACPGQLVPTPDGAIGLLDVPLDGDWSSVFTEDQIKDPEVFAAAKANAIRVGFTFGNSTGYGHGVSVSGPARFDVLEFSIE